eukprot:CAMPEP_0113497580 /NCGR_PEP_ID=MMETSP0014_2-20120614/30706_1 /TAXON_ID=2857 /ORGANISM="Nitzschia sp." /LENGTH=830 /DNA_ID=CAMNT_0000391529 /DNA_START=106 /DNA_END=2598 /DNA_ORIENTATION=- /assembly_acc=CAM_ASM_000159
MTTEGVEVQPPAIKNNDSSSDDAEDVDNLKKEAAADAGNDEDAAMEWDGKHEDFPMRTFEIKGRSDDPNNKTKFTLNPVVSVFAIAFLWGISIWCMTSPETAASTLIEWRARVTELFTWFYVGTNPAFMVFIIFLAFRFGHIRLGPQDSKPEFTDFAYFAMLFSAGIGVGLFFYGVSEPLWHQDSHWFANQAYRTQDEVDMFSLNLTVFHWGITGWSQYLVVAICAGLASFRFKLPMTLRSCFYTILGEYTWGWLGDIIDGFAIVATVTGVCTSLGLGAYQLAAGLQRVGAVEQDLNEDEIQKVHVISIWVITLIATCSVVSGLDVGIKYLSEIGFALGLVLMWLVFVLDKTNFLLNLMVQEVGYYFQWSTLLLNFHTDAFGQLQEGEGRAVDGQAAATWWMDAWTIFYIGWWVSWAAFVGLFIARISKGRTIGSIVLFSYVIPLVYTIMWFSIFGGTGLRQSRQAQELKALGEEGFGNVDHYLTEGSTYCYDVPQQDVVVNGTTLFTNTLIGVTPVCEFNSAEDDQAWFNVLYSYSFPLNFTYGFGPTLSWISLFALAVYFITSSDSGSLIVDHLASNGYPETHWTQRVFWAFTEGALATALLVSGGRDGLRAVQAASILSGLPFTLFLCLMCVGAYKMCLLSEQNNKDGTDISLKEHYSSRRVFKQPVYAGVCNIFEYAISFGIVHEDRKLVMPFPTGPQGVNFFIALFAPFLPYYKVLSIVYPKSDSQLTNKIITVVYALLFYGWIILFACMGISPGLRGWAWTAFMMSGCILTSLRSSVRDMKRIQGNMLHDIIVSLFVYPQVLTQMIEEMNDEEGEAVESKDVES